MTGFLSQVARSMTWEGKALAALFGVGILAWPMFSFGMLFIFDPPLESRSHEVQRYAFAYLTWLYPVLFVCSLVLYLFMRQQGVSRMACDLVWCIPALTPAYSIWFLWSRGGKF